MSQLDAPVVFRGEAARRSEPSAASHPYLEEVRSGRVTFPAAMRRLALGVQSKDLQLTLFKVGIELFRDAPSSGTAEALLHGLTNRFTKGPQGFNAEADALRLLLALDDSDRFPASSWSIEMLTSFTGVASAAHKGNLDLLVDVLVRASGHMSPSGHSSYSWSAIRQNGVRFSEAQREQGLDRLLQANPRIALVLPPVWDRAYLGPYLTAERFHAARARLDNDSDVGRLLALASLNWLSPEEARSQIESGPIPAPRLEEFTRATQDDGIRMVARVLQLGKQWHLHGRDLPALPHFSEIATDPEVLRLAASVDLSQGVKPAECMSRLFGLRCVADAQGSKKAAQSILHGALARYSKVLSSMGDRDARATHAWHFLEVAVRVLGDKGDRPDLGEQFKVTADIDFVVSLLRRHDFKDYFTTPSSDGMSSHTRQHARYSLLKGCRLRGASEPVTAKFMAALVENGTIDLSSLPKKELTVDIVGPAVKRDPQRLAELTKLEDFTRMARLLGVPVQLPVAVQEATKVAQSMQDAMAAADPLAVETAPRRRRTPR